MAYRTTRHLYQVFFYGVTVMSCVMAGILLSPFAQRSARGTCLRQGRNVTPAESFKCVMFPCCWARSRGMCVRRTREFQTISVLTAAACRASS